MRLIQLSDLHLSDAVDRLVNGFPVYENLCQIFDLALSFHPDHILCTGDLSDDGTAGSYQILEAIFAQTSIPVSILYGNHDRPLLNSRYRKSFSLDNWQILCLDSVKPNALWGEGRLSTAELEWLAWSLQQSDRSTILALHHHPVMFDSELAWLNQICLENYPEFCNLIREFPQVQAVIFGHIHREFYQQRENIHFLGAPSTCYQVYTSAENGPSSFPRSAGFRVIDLLDDRHFESFVVRLKDGSFDQQNPDSEFVQLIPHSGKS